jgi:DNA-cytosine methyltransferase
MKVLSLFDGMSCTQIALKNLGIKVDTYYASEIDKYGIQIAQKNFPDTIQLGDVKDIKGEDLPEIDLIVAGSPCQGFSFAGKQLAFDDPRSALFFEFVRILKEVKPKYFLLENVRMKKEFQAVISEQVSNIYPECTSGGLFGIEPILINSALLSAQNRNRLYWTNIPGIEQPEDLGIVLRDVLEYEPEEFTKMSDNFLKRNGERNCMIDDTKEKAHSFSAMDYVKNGRQGNYLACDNEGKPTYNTPKKVGMNVEEVKVRKHEVDIKGLQYLLRSMKEQSGKTNKQIATETDMPVTKVEHWFRTDTSFAIPGDDIWFKLKDTLGIKTDVFDKQIMEFEYRDGVYETKQRVYSENGKSPTLTSSNKEQYIETYNTPKQVGTAAEIKGYDIIKRVYSEDGKSPTLTTMGGGHREPKVAVKGGAIRGRAYDDKGKRLDKNGKSVANKTKQMLEVRKDNKSNAITTVQKDSVAVSKIRDKSKTVRSGGRLSYDRHEWDSVDELHWRKLTPLECERLQTVPDNYTEGVSNTQRYKMLGNGFTVRVIEHILKNMEV